MIGEDTLAILTFLSVTQFMREPPVLLLGVTTLDQLKGSSHVFFS